MKTIVAGSRTISSPQIVALAIEASGWQGKITEVVCGMASGVDTSGMIWASEHGIDTMLFPADWRTFKKSAGPRRNLQMAEYADALLLVWDGESKGSWDMLRVAERKGLELFVVTVAAAGPPITYV